MQAERVILETDENGQVSGLPRLPPCSKVEAIFVVLDSEKTDRPAAPSDSAVQEKPGRTLVEVFKRLNALANLPEDDNFSGEDHDKVLYGWEDRK
jgi:hypothetical protein